MQGTADSDRGSDRGRKIRLNAALRRADQPDPLRIDVVPRFR